MWYRIGILFFGLNTFLNSILAQEKDIRQELKEWVEKADVIIEGKILSVQKESTGNASLINCEVRESFKGPQQIQKIKFRLPSEQESLYKVDTENIFFLQYIEKTYTFLYAIKGNLFLTPRLREEVLKDRISRSDIVVDADIVEIEETSQKESPQNIDIVIHCKTSSILKGTIGDNFTAKYQRIKNQDPPHIIVFRNLSYIFFLKKNNNDLILINPYEGAYSQGRSLREAILRLGQKVPEYVSLAGKEMKGLQAFAGPKKDTFTEGEPIEINLLLQNVNSKPIELYNNELPFFTLFHIEEENGQPVKLKYPRKSEVPPIEKKYFCTIEKGLYVFEPFNLTEYGMEKPGNYVIYIEFNLPWEYTGKTIGKNGWTGKVVTNQIKISIQKNKGENR